MTTLKDYFRSDFLIGAAINEETIKADQALLKQEFNSITAENEMKFEEIHPEPGQYNFDVSDAFLSFAKAHDMGLRGHTLVWHNQTPDWFFQDDEGNDVTREVLLERMKDHIDTVVGRYKGEIYAWDVVNEAISDEAGVFLRPSKWLSIIGEDFIDYAFQYAHAADPDALLFYNDYNESNPEKREKIYALISGMKARGVPIHGMGMQAHWNLYDPNLDDIEQAILRYSECDVLIHVTEMDVSMFKFDDKRTDLTAPTEAMLEKQGKRYQAFFELFKKHASVIHAVTFWGVSDRYTWLNDFPVRGRKNWPFLFDENNQPKAFVKDLLK
ncbi:beta-xylanase [Halolactibacillus miurensis]|uniref:Beta-xylanase n=1 Tax=Halolactibacillus miurensis TaxID=306541 RepID=A0A1I6TCM0_9BACI|nr:MULTISPECIES: endo-1,4-beta-xylanase [Halolactibacillus]GEM04588.1 beta-xylanase [Halolactibacillus miurensis]SFS86903.1 endo-1,4-beta-xylanase [Halolactibacillus miurensis]